MTDTTIAEPTIRELLADHRYQEIDITANNVEEVFRHFYPMNLERPETFPYRQYNYTPFAGEVLYKELAARIAKPDRMASASDKFRRWPNSMFFNGGSMIKAMSRFWQMAVFNSEVHFLIPSKFFVDEDTRKVIVTTPYFWTPRSPRNATPLCSNAYISSVSREYANGEWQFRLAPHFHVDGTGICLGSESDFISEALHQNDFISVLDCVERVLSVYNPESPYTRPSHQFPPQYSNVDIMITDHHLTIEANGRRNLWPSLEKIERKLYKIPSFIDTQFEGEHEEKFFHIFMSDIEYESLIKSPPQYFSSLIYEISSNTQYGIHARKFMSPFGAANGNEATVKEAIESIGVQYKPGMNDNDLLMNAAPPTTKKGMDHFVETLESLANSDVTEKAQDSPTSEEDEDEWSGEDDHHFDEEEEEDESF